MTFFSHLKSHRGKRAFTLTEVSIAIAVAGISLFSVVGLLPTLLDSDEKSGANSILPTLATQALAEIKRQRASADGETNTSSYTFQFTADGALSNNAGEAVFECNTTLHQFSDLATNGDNLTLPDPGDHCLVAKMVFHWPAGTQINPQRRRTINATLTDD